MHQVGAPWLREVAHDPRDKYQGSTDACRAACRKVEGSPLLVLITRPPLGRRGGTLRKRWGIFPFLDLLQVVMNWIPAWRCSQRKNHLIVLVFEPRHAVVTRHKQKV